jgi:deazaflavin-dependent oxidoreductase (nitroreductase family)
MSTQKFTPWIKAHMELYATDPEKGHLWDASALGGPGVLPTLLLTTTGRRSGEPRTLPLIYGTTGDSYVIVASKGGMPNHPVWFLNLEANPECNLQIAKRHLSARARVATGVERERIWQEMAVLYPPYDEYQKTAGDRVIPVVVLDPVE